MGASSGFDTFQATLTLAGTAQRVEAPTIAPGQENPQIGSMVIRALKGNKGIIYLAGSSANATAAKGFELAAGDAISLDIQGGGGMWFNGTETGDKLCVAWVGP